MSEKLWRRALAERDEARADVRRLLAVVAEDVWPMREKHKILLAEFAAKYPEQEDA